MPLTITTKVTGTLDRAERVGLQQTIARINKLRATPLPAATNEDLKNSYEVILQENSASAHIANMEEAVGANTLQEVFKDESQLKDFRRSVIDLFNSGSTPDQILAKLK